MRYLPVACLAAVAIVAALQPVTSAQMQNWTDAEGKPFKGEPVGILGPYAMFRTNKRSTVGVRLRNMSPADCVRYYEASRGLPARAGEWSAAVGILSKEIFEHARVLKDGKIEAADLGGRPEPELFLLICGWHDHGETWESFGVIRPVYERLRATYPDLIEALFLGVKHDAAKHRRMITESTMPWLVTDFEDQRKMDVATRFLPSDPPMVVVVSRHGDLIYNSGPYKKGAIDKVLGEVEALLVQMKPGNARAAIDRKAYLTAIQTTAFRTGRCDPVLIASPLNGDALREGGVERIDANILIGPDHAVKDVQVSDNGGKLPAELVTAIASALRQAVFVAAVENGQFIEATYEMHVTFGP